MIRTIAGILTACLMALLLSSCEQTDPYSVYKIQGTWVLQTVNGDSISPDRRLALTLSDKDAATVAARYEGGTGAKYKSIWASKDGFKWKFHGTVLELSGTDYIGDIWAQHNTFRSVDEKNLTFTVKGSEVPESMKQFAPDASKSYNCKFLRLFSRDYSGTWNCKAADGAEVADKRIVIAGNKLNVQALEGGEWKDAYASAFDAFFYGSYLAVNYSVNDSTACSTWLTGLTETDSLTTWTWKNPSYDSRYELRFEKAAQ